MDDATKNRKKKEPWLFSFFDFFFPRVEQKLAFECLGSDTNTNDAIKRKNY